MDKIENDYAIKIAKYPPTPGDNCAEEDEFGTGAKMLRGPGQKCADPFQFIAAGKGGEDMAVSAKSTLQLAQQQKEQREKMLQKQSQKFDEGEPWQADLDTWRRKRKEKFGDRAATDSADTAHRVERNEEFHSYQPRKSKEEILQVNSGALPRQHSVSTTISPIRSSSDDLNNADSGIDNRTVDSPSISEFSPRSTDLFVSPKSLIDEEEPPHHPPPPPPIDEKLDQVLIPLKYSKAQEYAPIYRSIDKTRNYYDQCPDEDTEQRSRKEEKDLSKKSRFEASRSVERTTYMPVTSARVEATFKQPPAREGVKPFVSRAAQQSTRHEQPVENIDLTVELNREQKATVTATKYPRTDFVMEEHRPQAPPPLKSSSTTRIYHAVDIPFDESPATYQTPAPRRHSTSSSTSSSVKTDGMFALQVIMGSQPVHKGMGFTVQRTDSNRTVVESVIVGSPADKAGLLVGDTILSINGEDVSDTYPSGVARILHEAARMGEADVLILRAPASAPLLVKQSSSSVNSATFDKARSVFADSKSFDSYAEFKRKHTRDSTTSSSRSSRDFNSLPRGSTAGAHSLDRQRRDASLSSYRTARDNFNSSSARSSGRSEYGDYRVTSYQEKNAPGRLTDFVPEVDRRMSRRDRSEDAYSHTRGTDGGQAKTIRNFHLSNENIARTNLNYDGRRGSEDESATTTLKRSTLPRNGTTNWKSEESSVEEIVEKVPVSTHEPLRSALKKPSHNYYPDVSPPPRRYFSTESIPIHVHKTSEYVDEEREREEEYQRMYHRQPERTSKFDDYHTVGSYGVHRPRARSHQPPNLSESLDDDVSGVTHRFYDRQGNYVVPRERQQQARDIEIRREYGNGGDLDLDFVRNTYQWEEQEEVTTTRIFEKESRDWRDVINEQRQPAPGYQADRRGIAATSASLSNLPNYINRRMEKEREREIRAYDLPPADPPLTTEKYERDEYSRVEKRTYPVPVQRNTVSSQSHSSQVQSHSHSSHSQSQTQSSQNDSVVAVSGKHRCAHCNEELGRGAAMIVESLNLFYHLACFKCYVCKTSLGSGATGADVRVRDGRLHCQACYSNDRVQLSKV